MRFYQSLSTKRYPYSRVMIWSLSRRQPIPERSAQDAWQWFGYDLDHTPFQPSFLKGKAPFGFTLRTCLVVKEENTDYCLKALANDPKMLVWCLSRVEVMSALCRRVRDASRKIPRE